MVGCVAYYNPEVELVYNNRAFPSKLITASIDCQLVYPTNAFFF